MNYIKQRIIMASTLCLSLFLIGSCNERATFFDFKSYKPDLAQMSQGQLIRHAYAVQAGLMNNTKTLKHLRVDDIRLALAVPDLARVDGKGRHWQYQSQSCVLDVYWRDGAQDKAIQHHEFRERQLVAAQRQVPLKKATGTTCLQSLIQERRAYINAQFDRDYAVLSLNAHKS